ncbi:phenylalanine--tRNA ligase subunit beta [bacterium]|nr:MAG: phenylalanine--tRNA ligase subunit beta [bacterium]
MNIKITDNALRHFLNTSVISEEVANYVSLCGPTFDRVTKLDHDYLYEIEIITNRIDMASAQGIARDSVAILNQRGLSATLQNDPYREKINLYSNLPKTFTFEIDNPDLVPRFTAVSLENIQIKDSPEDTKNLLTLCGERPINNAVDITNELTILYGMPIHIFDLDKLAAQKLTIRESKKGEEITTLDDQKSKLKGGDIIIEDGAGRIVDLCGIMGGQVAEVDVHTKNILLIVPVYHPDRIRKTSLYLQKRTLAAQIYEKQPDMELCLPVLMKAIKLFEERAGARASSGVYDSNPNSFKLKEVALDINWATSLIGVSIPVNTVVSILESLGFNVKNKNKDILICTVPSWRYYDINIREDLVEEIARVYGYSKILPKLPCVNLPPERKSSLLITESKIKNLLSCQGFNEVYNSSLISLDLINKTSLSESNHIKLANTLSKDFEYLRTSLVPSILQSLKNNQGKSEEPFYLYELSNIYQKTGGKLPDETSKLVITSTVDFRNLKGYLESLFINLHLKPYTFKTTANAPTYFLDGNTAEIISDGKGLGFIGTIKPAVLHNVGITSNPTVIELDTESIAISIKKNLVYQPISDFPEVVEQVTISSKLGVGDIMEKIHSTSKLINKITYTDSFQNNHSFKIHFSSLTRNLTQSEVNDIKKSIQELFS